MKKILIVVNKLSFFISHRLDIALSAIEKGYEVSVAYGDKNQVKTQSLKDLGINCHHFSLNNKSLNPINEIITIFSLYNLLKNYKPDVVHLISIKCYLYGGILARILKINAVVTAIAGLGILVTYLNEKRWYLNKLLYYLFKLSMGHHNQAIIVQNRNDETVLAEWGVLNPDNVYLIKGSGINLKKFKNIDKKTLNINICFASRLLKEKGILEYIEAAKILFSKEIKANFIIAGEIYPDNPTSLKEKEIVELSKLSNVSFIGFVENINQLYQNSDIVCLPSYYGEGVPKSLIEAAACARAVITTDHPGCRDAIIPNITGLLVPIKNPIKLAEAIQFLIENPIKRIEMGKAGRKFAEQEFCINKIVEEHIKIYEKLLDFD